MRERKGGCKKEGEEEEGGGMREEKGAEEEEGEELETRSTYSRHVTPPCPGCGSEACAMFAGISGEASRRLRGGSFEVH
eukprot:3681710-Pyramimonas_sp.AAC.1